MFRFFLLTCYIAIDADKMRMLDECLSMPSIIIPLIAQGRKQCPKMSAQTPSSAMIKPGNHVLNPCDFQSCQSRLCHSFFLLYSPLTFPTTFLCFFTSFPSGLKGFVSPLQERPTRNYKEMIFIYILTTY